MGLNNNSPEENTDYYMSMLLYHHCFPFEAVKFGKIKPSRRHTTLKYGETKDPIDLQIIDLDIRANLWLKKRVGFYPLFFAVGTQDDDIRSTGYADQWRKLISQSRNGNTYRQKGDFPNEVLFSFADIENAVYIDGAYWPMVFNTIDEEVTKHWTKIILKKSWTRGKWLKKSLGDFPCSVMAVAPEMDLRNAQRIWVRNRATQKALKKMGFSNIEVKRLTLEGDSN